MREKISLLIYHIIRGLVKVFYPKTQIHGAENLPEGPAIVIGNHAKMNGPIVSDIYFPGKHRIWIIGEMMHRKEVPAYAFQDFWSRKPGWCRWFFKLLSYVIAPFAAAVFGNADTIGVYHDSRIMSTLRESVKALNDGAKVIILPEQNQAHNNILCEFQQGFVDVASLYYRKYKQEPSFVPMYTCPALKGAWIGEPVKFDASAPLTAERVRISQAMMDSITALAYALQEHTVVPYPNLPKKQYPTNRMTDMAFDTTGLFRIADRAAEQTAAEET